MSQFETGTLKLTCDVFSSESVEQSQILKYHCARRKVSQRNTKVYSSVQDKKEKHTNNTAGPGLRNQKQIIFHLGTGFGYKGKK